ncbi:MAG TPA: MFS transporter, partial [Burkholderiaceae bacterium]
MKRFADDAATRPSGVPQLPKDLPPQRDGLPQPQRGWAVFVILLGIAMAVLDGSIVNLALPTIAQELHATPATAIWVVNAYQLAVLGLLLPLATLGDLVGYRRVYLYGGVLFTLASLGCALSTSLPMLAVLRVAQGLGAAGLMSVNTAIVRQVFPARLLGRGMALNSMVVAISAVAGPSIAAAILSVSSWPLLFAINVPLGLLVVWLGREVLPDNAQLAAPGVRIVPLDVLLNVAM